MTIQEIREAGHAEIADLADLRRKEAGRPGTGLGCAFDWLYTKEYHTFWMYVYDGEFEQAYQIVSLEEIKKRIGKKEMKPKKREEIEEICIEVIKKLGLLKPVESELSNKKEKAELPTIIDEIRDIVQLPATGSHAIFYSKSNINNLMLLDKLIAIRDVYRQGWNPDWSDMSDKYAISIYNNNLAKETFRQTNQIFSFQTGELRDKFLSNFKEELETVKELWN